MESSLNHRRDSRGIYLVNMTTFLRKTFYFLSLLLAASSLFALPEGEEVVAGQADFHASDGRSVKISTSDKAIINYQKFNLSEGEHVQFIQPSAKSSVLNRVTGKDPSKILGKISANGRVFLVNSNGVYFGPNATVNTGSFLASTLNIHDEDFLNDKLHFFQEAGSEKSSIINEGKMTASHEGFVALFAPFIENRGSILARAGKIILAAAERVTLDFSGDGLIQFTVDGDLKQALIENYGHIEAAQGNVEISLRTARDAIKMVVNSDGITPAN
ncbi:MAG: filamentous hemagglutinin N-terminal domain-containing protein, partial [Rhabdochlamydiaceae bacterium]